MVIWFVHNWMVTTNITTAVFNNKMMAVKMCSLIVMENGNANLQAAKFIFILGRAIFEVVTHHPNTLTVSRNKICSHSCDVSIFNINNMKAVCVSWGNCSFIFFLWFLITCSLAISSGHIDHSRKS